MKSIYVVTFVALTLLLLIGCGAGNNDATPTTSLNVPSLPPPPIGGVVLPADYVGFFIGIVPLSTDRQLATSQQFTQQLYTLDADNLMTPVTFIDAQGVALDLIGNLSFTTQAQVIPLDVMVMNPDYIMLAMFDRNFDNDTSNDYFNLLVDLRTGNVVSAPVGLNEQGNSGRSSLTKLGRDYFPPDSRWNDTDDLYVISVDYEALDMMDELDKDEIVDHHTGVPCPDNENDADAEQEEATDDANQSDETTDDTADDTAQGDDTNQDADNESEQNEVTEEAPICTEPVGGTVTPTPDTPTTETPVADEPVTDDTVPATPDTGVPDSSIPTAPTIPTNTAVDDAPIATNIYKMRLGAANQYSLEKVSLEDDRPALGQFVVSRSGIMIYRNTDGGDNSYRVLIEDCEDETGRLSTVLLAPYSSLIVADDDAGNSSIFEVTERGFNKLIFSCNGNVIRESFTGYTTSISSLRLPYNSESIASYDYIYPYFVNSSCQGGRAFPRPEPEVEILNPLPAIIGLPNSDVRGLRKSQMFSNSLYCIGYDAGLNLAIAQLDTSANSPNFDFLNFDFGLWLPDFASIHVLSDNEIIFTGTSRVSTDIKTILLSTDGTEVDLTDTIAGLKVAQQIEIVPPTGTTYSSSLLEE